MANRMRAKSTNVFVWVLMGLLIVGLIGFGTGSFTGNVTAVGAVGEEKVTVRDYARALNNQLQQLAQQTGQPISMQQARALGIDRAVLDQVLAGAALSGEARQAGLSVGDREVLRQLRETRAFQGVNGQFDQQSYDFALENAGLSPAQYDEIIRTETARNILVEALGRGPAGSDAYATTILGYLQETRDLTWARVLRPGDATELADPTEGDLADHYAAHPDRFTVPPQRRITFAWITPDALMDQVEVSAEEIQKAYDANADRYSTPERRLVEQLVFADQAAADDAKARLDSGGTDFDALVAERGLELADIDLGDITRDALPAAAADVVFGADDLGVVGPALSRLGPALFRINGILAASETTLAEAEEELRDELMRDRARRQIDALTDQVDDLLAAGATLEELDKETVLSTESLAYAAGDDSGPLAYEEFRTAADAVAEGDFPEALRLSDGGLFALRLDGVEPARLLDFAEARDMVDADWRATRELEADEAHAAALVGQLESGTDFATVGLIGQTATGLTRTMPLDGAPSALVGEAFAAEQGAVVQLSHDGTVFLARVDKVTAFDAASETNAAVMDQIRRQSAAELGQDLLQGFVRAIQDRDGITLDQAALNAVLSQSAGSGVPHQ